MVLLGLSQAAEDIKWETIPEAKDSAQCIYRNDINVFACRVGPKSEIVECPSSFEGGKFGTNSRFEVYGMARASGMQTPADKANDVKYFLYPRTADNQTYFDHKFTDGKGGEENVHLYFSENDKTAGFRIKDLKCYEKLVRLFDTLQANHPGTLQQGGSVQLFGEVLVFQRPVNKRWLWLSPWMWSWGWFGGWGWPWIGAGMIGK